MLNMSSSLEMKRFEGRKQAFQKVGSHIMKFVNFKNGGNARYSMGHQACYKKNIVKPFTAHSFCMVSLIRNQM